MFPSETASRSCVIISLFTGNLLTYENEIIVMWVLVSAPDMVTKGGSTHRERYRCLTTVTALIDRSTERELHGTPISIHFTILLTVTILIALDSIPNVTCAYTRTYWYVGSIPYRWFKLSLPVIIIDCCNRTQISTRLIVKLITY